MYRCNYCSNHNTMDCPESIKCYAKEDKPYFKYKYIMKDFVREIRIIEKVKTFAKGKGFQTYYYIQIRFLFFWITIRKTLGCNKEETINLVKKLNIYF